MKISHKDNKNSFELKIKKLIQEAFEKSGLGQGSFLENIEWFWKNIKSKNFSKKKVELPIGKIENKTAKIIGAKEKTVWLRSITFGKIRGWRKKEGFNGHSEINQQYFRAIPFILFSPEHVIKRFGRKGRYLLVGRLEKKLTLVIEIGKRSEKNWLITAFLTRERYLQKKEKDCLKHKKMGGSAGTAVSPILASDEYRSGGSRFSTLQNTQTFYTKLERKCQEDILCYKKVDLRLDDIELEHPVEEIHGDYATNLALHLSKKLEKSPLEIAKQIVKNLPKTEFIEKVAVAKPGFINLWLSKKALFTMMIRIIRVKDEYGKNKNAGKKKIMVEFAHPNTHKQFHIGHLRNIITGESIVRILEANGYKIIRANYQGDVGLHIAKCLWQIKNARLSDGQEKLKMKNDNLKFKNLNEKINFLGKSYVLGNKAYEENEKVKKEIEELNRKIYEKDSKIMPLWQETRQWSLNYFARIYKRVYTKFDRLYFESEVAYLGKKIVLENLKKGIFQKSQSAIIFDGSRYGLHKRVFINKLGFPTYEAKDMGLAELQFQEYHPQKIIHVVGPEQKGYFEVIFEALGKIWPEIKGKEYHLQYGWVRLKKGKMSSREGNVILAEWLLDEVKKKIKKIMEKNEEFSQNQKEKISEIIAVAAVKYSMLKINPCQDLAFDIDESISLEGNSGPYLQYTYARAQSVLRKSQISSRQRRDKSRSHNLKLKTLKLSNFNNEEMAILRTLYRFPEVISAAGENYAPNLIAGFLYDLAQKFNAFYNKHQILKAESKKKRNFRLSLTAVTAQVIKNGLNLLGIQTLERM